MAVQTNISQINAFVDFSNLHPEELLLLFEETAPHILKQIEAQLIFKELTTYITDDEEKKLFYAWEDILLEPGKFYSTIHELLNKYKRNS